MSVEVNNVTKLYGEQRALDNVSFSIGNREVVGLLGPNGAGKSTMMKIICCYLPQNEGTVNVLGKSTIEDSIEVRRNVGYLPEHNPLYLDMYVKEYLAFVAAIYLHRKEVDKRVNDMIEITGLGLEQKKKIGALSKGFRQRVGLAQAMIHNPGVLVMDEPTSGLDPNQLSEIRSLIKEIGKEKTVIMSTHIMQEVEAICSRVIIINKGKIVADDTTDMLRKGGVASSVFTVEFDKAVDQNIFSVVDGITSIEMIGDNKWKIISSDETDVRPAIFKLAVDNGLTVLAMMKEERKLEDVFQLLTK
jgi:ABC-2 type transport system ATP-binding protein